MENQIKQSNRDFVILTDTACDLSNEMLNTLNITALPMHVLIDDEDFLHYADYRNLSNEDFIEKLKTCKDVKTTQIDTETANTTMKKLLSENKDIIYIAFSSGLSGSYSTGKMVAEELLEDFPQNRITVIDSLCASGGEGLLVYLAAKKKEEGLTYDELTNWIETNKLKIGHWFTVDDLQHLKRGGRISATTAAVGGFLTIKPVMYMDDDGHLVAHGKAFGRKKSIEALVDKMEKYSTTKEFDTIMISQIDCLDDAELLKSMLHERFAVKEVVIVTIDPIISAHTGCGCISLFFEGVQRTHI